MSSGTPGPEYGLTRGNLLSTLPAVLQRDPSVLALAESIAGLLAMRPEEIDRLRIYPAIDALKEPLLDILAHDFKVDWWDPEYSLEEKRRTLKTSWKVHKTLGTKAAVETALSAVYAGAKVEEWFEYGGEPYHFRVHVKVGDSEYVQSKHKRVLARIEWYKNLRSHMDRIWYEMPLITFQEKNDFYLRNFGVHLRASNWGIVLLNGEHPLDGSWLLDQAMSRLYMAGVRIRTSVRMPHRLGPGFVRISGIGVLTRERVPLTIHAGTYFFSNMGDFVKLDGKHPLDGGWLLDQYARAPRFSDFGVRVQAKEPEGRFAAVSTNVRVTLPNETQAGISAIKAGVYTFGPTREQISCTVRKKCTSRVEVHNAAPLMPHVVMRMGWQNEHRIVSGLPVVRVFFRNHGAFRPVSTYIRTSVQEETGGGKVHIRPSVTTFHNSAGGLNASLTIFRADRMNGTHLFDGSRTFGGGDREVIQL